MADRVGQQLGNYRLVQLLGRGGFAEVYLGEHVYLETKAAIKVLQTQLAREDMEQFRIEARTIACLEHPHIVRVFDFGIEGETPYLVMDYAPNGTMRKRHPKGVALSIPTILNYVKQAASALQYAHNEHFVHRDVKPENLLLGRQEEVLLGDFGIALLAQTSRSQSMQDVAGTANYMAPEQFQGKPRPASDQYSLAIMVYEWLTGACPFHGSFTEVASQHLFVPPPPLQGRPSTISPAVEQVVMTALAKDPKERFASIHAFATALEQASQVEARAGGPFPLSLDAVTDVSESQQPTQLATALSQSSIPTELVSPSSQVLVSRDVISETALTEAATRSTPSPQSVQPKKKRSSRKTMQPTKMSAPPLLPSEPTVSVFPAGPSPASALPPTVYAKVPLPPSPLPPTQLASVSPSLGTVLCAYRGHSESVYAVAWSPDGVRIVSESDHQAVQMWDAGTGKTLLTYRGHSGSVQLLGVAWSPDGRRIASAGTGVQVWDATTGQLLRGFTGSAVTVAWSPDGKYIASGSSDKTVQVWDAVVGKRLLTRVWDAATDQAAPTYRSHTGSVNAVAWSPDGRRIASGSFDKTVHVWDAATERTLFTYRGHADGVNAVAWSPDGRRIASGSDDKTVQVWVAE